MNHAAGSAIVLLILCAVALAQGVGDNLALGKPYTMTPPNYGLCSDPDDAVQLTDGAYTKGHFWTQKTTVGWSGGSLKYVNIDLGERFPIQGVVFSTAAGVAEVHWPRHIVMFTSDDGQAWHELGDLMRMVDSETLPEFGTYAALRIETQDLRTHGRYLQLAMEAEGAYLFCDEIEVLRGPEEFLALPLPGEAVADVPQHMGKVFYNLLIKEQFERDLQAVREDIELGAIAAEQAEALSAKADALADAINDMGLIEPEGFRAVLPMTDLERSIFALQAEVWRAEGKPSARVWRNHRWDWLAPSDEPEAEGEAAMSVRMMNGEVRAEVLNFSNASNAPMTLRLSLEGLPAAMTPGAVTVRQVLHVGTRRFVSVAAALPEAEMQDGQWLIPVPPGMTMQAWFEFRPQSVAAGEYQASVRVAGGPEELSVPLRLTISKLRFPSQTRMILGGWDYTDGNGTYGITPNNLAEMIEYMRDHGVNTTWASGGACPEGKYDPEGNLIEDPDTTRFDQWVARWPGARMFMVYVSTRQSFAGEKMGTPQFEKRLGNWARFWADHMRGLGLKPSQLGLLVHDEPMEELGYRINEEFGRVINAAAPELVMFVDPQPLKPDGPLAMYEQMDVICPHRPLWLVMDWFDEAFAAQRQKGKELWLYSAAGPTRSFDPFSYYLMQGWHAFAIGGKGSHFWAFGDDGRSPAWNEYLAPGVGPYCPMYLEPDRVTTAKWFEALRDSAQDFEYLSMLQDAVAKLDAAGQGEGDFCVRARKLLHEGPARVMSQEKGQNYRWDETKDRSLADQVRGEVLDLLEEVEG